MSSILFGGTVSMSTAATPSVGWLVAYDTDGTLKQKDSSGVVSPLGGGGGLSGGTLNYVTKWTSTTTISSTSSIFDNGNVGIGSTASSAKFYIRASDSLSTGNVFNIINPSGQILNMQNDGHLVINGLNAGRGPSNQNQNTAFGRAALNLATGTGDQNSAFGSRALELNDGGSENVAIGSNAMQLNVSGVRNVAIGHQALRQPNSASYNVAIGYNSGFYVTSGSENVFIGNWSGLSTTTGVYNVAVGNEAGYTMDSASFNAFLGYQAGYSTTTGSINIAIGYQGLYSNSTGQFNIAIGSLSLYNSTGNSNIAIGYNSLFTNTTGEDNISIGQGSLLNNSVGNSNVAIGKSTLPIVDSDFNTVVGTEAGSDTTGSYNTLLGYNTGGGIGNGTHNTVLGAQVSGITTGITSSIFIADGYGNTRIFSNNLGYIGISTLSPNVVLDIKGDFATRHNNTPVVLSASNTGVSTIGYSYLLFDSNNAGSPCDIYGFADGYNGKRLVITNLGPDILNLYHEDPTETTAANRIITGYNGTSPINLSASDTCELIYDAYTQRWRVIALDVY